MTYNCKQPLCESIHVALILQSWRLTTKNFGDLIRDDLSIFNYERWSFVPSCPSDSQIVPKKKRRTELPSVLGYLPRAEVFGRADCISPE